MILRIYSDLESLSRAAAGLFLQQAEQASKARRRFSVALSGGQTPGRTYEFLAQPPFRDRANWAQVHVFWGDERCVPGDDPRSNAFLARQAWLDHVPIPPGQIHPICCDKSVEQTAEAAAAQYHALLQAFFGGRSPRLDLIFLGLGENGHTASLFPGTAVLGERERWAAPVYVTEENLYRITLTPPIINQGATVAFLVAGAAKAGILKEVLEGPHDPLRLPAQLIRPQGGQLQWLVDREAAAQLHDFVRLESAILQV